MAREREVCERRSFSALAMKPQQCDADASGSSFLRAEEGVVRVGMGAIRPLTYWLPCGKARLTDAEERFPYRAPWREPIHSSLCCLPNRTSGSPGSERCFRGVYDDIIEGYERQWEVIGQKVRMRTSIKRSGGEQGWELGRVVRLQPPLIRRTSGSGREAAREWDEVRPIDERDDTFDLALVEQARRVLVHELGLRDEWVEPSVHRRQAIEPTAPSTHRNAWHVDYFESEWAHFAAILYLTAPEAVAGDKESNGWTGFVDCEHPNRTTLGGVSNSCNLERLPNGTALLTRGLMVAPRPGRLVIFTTGAENYHAPLPVASGRRRSLQMWFRCRCTSRS